MARPRFKRTPSTEKSPKEPEVKAQQLAPDSAEPIAKTQIDPNDPALLDEPALLGAPVDSIKDVATLQDETPMPGDDPALLDDVGGLTSRPDIGGLAEGDDLGLGPDGNDPLGLGKVGRELNPDGNFNPAGDLLDNLDSGRPGGASLDESSAGGVLDDLRQKVANTVAGSGNKEQSRQLEQVDDGIGKTKSTIAHGGAVDASANDDADGADTPSQSGMPALTDEQLTKLADDMTTLKATLGPTETQDINRHGKTFVVRGAADADTEADETTPEDETEPAGATEDYVDGEDPLLGRTDFQQEYQDMQIDAIRGSEVNPDGTEEYYNDAEMPNFDDISGANDPTGMPAVETPAYLEGTVPDEGVIDPVD